MTPWNWFLVFLSSAVVVMYAVDLSWWKTNSRSLAILLIAVNLWSILVNTVYP